MPLAFVPVTNQPFSDTMIAKAGHVVVYGVLGWLVMDALSEPAAGLALGRRAALAVTFLLCAILAMLDETRQLFVYGRSGAPLDVLIDTVAASSSALLHQRLSGLPGAAGSTAPSSLAEPSGNAGE